MAETTRDAATARRPWEPDHGLVCAAQREAARHRGSGNGPAADLAGHVSRLAAELYRCVDAAHAWADELEEGEGTGG